jgi:dTDP-glucose pyrophosphorylase
VGIHDIGIIVGYTPDRIKSVTDVIGDGGRWGINIVYISSAKESLLSGHKLIIGENSEVGI